MVKYWHQFVNNFSLLCIFNNANRLHDLAAVSNVNRWNETRSLIAEINDRDAEKEQVPILWNHGNGNYQGNQLSYSVHYFLWLEIKVVQIFRFSIGWEKEKKKIFFLTTVTFCLYNFIAHYVRVLFTVYCNIIYVLMLQK